MQHLVSPLSLDNYIWGKIESGPNILQYQVHRKLEGNKTSQNRQKKCKIQTKYILSKSTILKVQIKLPQNNNKHIGAVLSAHVTNTVVFLMRMGRIWHFTSTEHWKHWKTWIPLTAAVSLYCCWQPVNHTFSVYILLFLISDTCTTMPLFKAPGLQFPSVTFWLLLTSLKQRKMSKMTSVLCFWSFDHLNAPHYECNWTI